MRINKKQIADHNEKNLAKHKQRFSFISSEVENVEAIIKKLIEFQVAIPSWALGTGGTRFGRFPGPGEPGNIEQKMEDVGMLHALNQSSGAISLHIPWDIPEDYKGLKNLACELDLKFDAVNSNTFQDQPDQSHTYK